MATTLDQEGRSHIVGMVKDHGSVTPQGPRTSLCYREEDTFLHSFCSFGLFWRRCLQSNLS